MGLNMGSILCVWELHFHHLSWMSNPMSLLLSSHQWYPSIWSNVNLTFATTCLSAYARAPCRRTLAENQLSSLYLATRWL